MPVRLESKAMGPHPVAALVIVGAFLAVAAGPTVQAVAAPTLTVGDFWVYSTNTTADAGFDLVGQVSFTIVSRGPTPISGRTYDAVRVTVSGHGAVTGRFPTPLGDFPVTGTWIVTGTETLETLGYKVVSSVLDLQASGSVQMTPLTQDFSLHVQNTTTFDILNDSWRFPREVGDSGSVTMRYDSVEDFRFQLGLVENQNHTQGSGTLRLNYSMSAETSAPTQAGTFDAFQIREDWPDGRQEVSLYAPAVGNDARREMYNRTGAQIVGAELVSYRYQALEPATFLGLATAQWTIVLAVIAAAVGIAVIFLIRRRKKKALRLTQMPPTS